MIGARKAKSALHQPLPQLPGSDSGGSSPNDSGSGSVNVRLSKVSGRDLRAHAHLYKTIMGAHYITFLVT